jgi:hypothetical protein
VGIKESSEAAALARRLLEAVAAPYEVAGRTIDIGTSIGIAVAPKDGEDPDELLRKADHALYRCKGGARKLCFLRAGRRAQKAGRSPEVKAGINDKRYIKASGGEGLRTGVWEARHGSIARKPDYIDAWTAVRVGAGVAPTPLMRQSIRCKIL